MTDPTNRPNPDDAVDNETTLAEVNDDPSSTERTEAAADGERIDDDTVLSRMNDNPPHDREERP